GDEVEDFATSGLDVRDRDPRDRAAVGRLPSALGIEDGLGEAHVRAALVLARLDHVGVDPRERGVVVEALDVRTLRHRTTRRSCPARISSRSAQRTSRTSAVSGRPPPPYRIWLNVFMTST